MLLDRLTERKITRMRVSVAAVSTASMKVWTLRQDPIALAIAKAHLVATRVRRDAAEDALRDRIRELSPSIRRGSSVDWRMLRRKGA